MTAKEILAELKPLGSDGYKKVMSNDGGFRRDARDHQH